MCAIIDANVAGEVFGPDAIVALAQVSGARLLYSNDRNLQQDFGNKAFIDKPRGKVCSTLESGDLTKVHKGLLLNKGLCRDRKRRSS